MTRRTDLEGTDDDAPIIVDDTGLPPVVARLVVEIRSDGSRTIARGALEDVAQGQKVAVQAEGKTPLALALALARALFQMPTLARTAARALLPGRVTRRNR